MHSGNKCEKDDTEERTGRHAVLILFLCVVFFALIPKEREGQHTSTVEPERCSYVWDNKFANCKTVPNAGLPQWQY